MKIKKHPYPLFTVSSPNVRVNIDTNPDYQRPSVWSVPQKQLLIDTILRGYDIPKMYWRQTGSKPDKFEVVDGQQRLRTIWDYFDGKFGLPSDAEKIDGVDVANLKITDLPIDLLTQLQSYSVDVVIMEDSDEDEVREMFLRLQNGTSLKAQEKRNAMPGKMRDFVKQLTEHDFFKKVKFDNARFTYDHVAAQLVCLEIAGEPANVKNADLNRIYKENLEFSMDSPIAKSVVRTLNTLSKIFPEKTPELERYNVISLYCVIAELQRQFAFSEISDQIHDWFIGFETERRNQEFLDDEQGDPEWISYKEKISHSTDAQESIRFRMEFMMRHLLNQFPQLKQKDNQREFTPIQKLAIYRRDKGICQLKIKCDGKKVVWGDWHCDHKQAWVKGGQTTVENGQVSCPECNLSKSDS
jgi:hypothetical protein